MPFSPFLSWLSDRLTVNAENPDYPADEGVVRAAVAEMMARPVRLPRPVVILSGYRQPRFQAAELQGRLCRLTGADPTNFLVVSYPLRAAIPQIVDHAIRAVQGRWPSQDARVTAEVDVVGISMGGLIARAAATPSPRPWKGKPDPERRLNIRRLYTLATPHRGAVLANLVAPDPAARDMVPGSAFLGALNGGIAGAEYELTCYARLRDGWVGARNTAPPGHVPIWVSGLLWGSHATISRDRRVLADLARRLRGEEGLGRVGEMPPRD